MTFLNYIFNSSSVGNDVEFCTVRAAGFKTACVSIRFSVPLARETVSHYALVPYIITHSTKKYPSYTALEKKLASLYGADVGVDITKAGENQEIEISVSCIDDRFALEGESIVKNCCELLFDMVFEPNITDGAFPADETENEKRILREQLGAEKSDKRIYARNRCEEIMCENEAFGINKYGTCESIDEVTPESLAKAYYELLKTASVCVCISGNTDFEAIKELTAARFAALPRKVCEGKTLFVKKADAVKNVKETEPVKQGKLVMGFRLGMENEEDCYAARRVMIDLFGGSPHSKLFTVVREKMSLCYYCSARMFRKKGIMYVQSGIETYNAQKAREAILAQLQAIKDGEFTDEELEYSIKSLEDSFKSVTDSPEALSSWFLSQSSSGRYLYPDEYITMFKAVTKQQVMQAAADVTLDTVFMLEGSASEDDGEDDE